MDRLLVCIQSMYFTLPSCAFMLRVDFCSVGIDAAYGGWLLLFDEDTFLAAIAALYVAMSVRRLVGWLVVGWSQRVSKSKKFLKDALNHNVTVSYALCILLCAYYTLCILNTMSFLCIMHMILRILLVVERLKLN